MKNKFIRQMLEQLYGKGCFFQRGEIEKKIEGKVIRTYKEFTRERKFTGQKISNQITLHHLKHRSEGGETSVKNGANVSQGVHQYIHSLPRDQEEIINNELRIFKYNIDVASMRVSDEEIKIDEIKEFSPSKEYIEIQAFNQDSKNNSRNARYNRRKEKRRLQKIYDDYIDR